jgi:hypothetical protein
VVGARHLDRLEHVLETELLEAVGADVEILETPVDPSTFRTATALGLTVPNTLLVSTDEVIE